MAKKKTDAQNWLDRIDRAKKVRDNWRNLFRVPTCYEYWEGRQRPNHIPEHEWITINMVFSNLMAELPSLYSTDPYFYVKLSKSYSINPMDIVLFEDKAKVRMSMLNYLKRELKLKSKARLSILDSFFQYGLCKIHHSADLAENPDFGKVMMEDDEPLIGEDDSPIMEPEFLPANEAYHVSRIHPDDFLVDEDAGPLDENVNWKAHRIKRAAEEVRADKKYRASARKAVQPTEVKGDPIEAEREQRKKGGIATGDGETKEPDTVILWEIYDIRNKQWLTIAEGCKEFLIDPEPLPAGIEQDPFVDLRFVLRDDSWYPIPPISQWLDPQREYCELRSKFMVHRKRFNRKYEAWTGCFDDPDTELAKLESGEDGTILQKNQPVQAVWPIADATLDQQHNMEITYIRQDFMDLAVGPNQRGATAGVDSATEAGILEKRTQMREGDKQGLVLDFLSDIAKKLDQCVQAHITQDQAVKISGVGGEESWALIRAADYDEIAGEYQYSIATGSTTPQLPEIERAQWLAFLGIISQSPQLALSKSLLRKTAEMHHISPDDPLVEELHQIAKQMASGQIPMPGQQGSAAGVSEERPISAMGGMAAGMNNIRGGAQ